MSEPFKLASGCCRPISHGGRTPIRFPQSGELVLLNVDVTSDLTSAVPSASGVTLTQNSTISSGEKNIKPHHCIVSHVYQDSVQNTWYFKALVIRSYSYKPNPVEFVASLGDIQGFTRHLPLPPPPSCSPLPTPAVFGRPVEIPVVLGKYSWIVAENRTFDMGANGCVRLVPRSNLMEHS
jgi:hypothetical protein